MTPKILFQGELQLAMWGESSTAGAWVKFWVHPEDLESFKHLKARAGKQAGQRIGAVMVEIADDEALVPEEPKPTPRASYPKAHIGRVASTAVGYCNSPDFQRWAPMVARATDGDHWSADRCKAYILDVCGVTYKHGEAASRKHLDTDGEAALLFEQKIRRPYVEWLASQEGFA